MKEGVSQGCPLSPIFATLVLHQVLEPLAESLHQQAQLRLGNRHPGDDGFGGASHIFAYVDDISSTVPLEDISFFCTKLEKLGAPRGCFLNPSKTRILTSTSNSSVIPQLQILNPQLANDLTNTLQKYSIQQTLDSTTTPIKLTTGFRLLGTPVRSHSFADSFYESRLSEIFSSLDPLDKAITDTHTRLKNFNQCILQKLPHLLDSAVMHSYPITNTDNPWYNWEGNLSFGINSLLHSFLRSTLGMNNNDYLPTYAILIAHINTNKGGLRMLNASIRAAPDFILNMMFSKQRALHGFTINKDIPPILHTSISDLYTQSTNTHSIHLQQYALLLPQIGPICCHDQCPQNNCLKMIETSLSYHSACSRIKNYNGKILLGQLYTEVTHNAPEHLHLLPSILLPQTSYPLMNLARSLPRNCLPNWATKIALQQKLQLPVYDPNNTPICRCGTKFDCWRPHILLLTY